MPNPTAASFESWYERMSPNVVRAVFAMTGDADLAREITAEAFARAYRRQSGLAAALDSPDAWVVSVALNLVKRRWRRERLAGAARTVLASATTSTVEQPLPDVDLLDAVKALPERQRQAIALRYFADLKEADVARAMDITEGAASAHLTKARQALERALRDPAREMTDEHR